MTQNNFIEFSNEYEFLSETYPMVSVLMLSYNHSQYISQAIESVLAQKTDFPFEILVGDDASTDDSPEILKKYANKYPDIVHLVLRNENLGTTKNAYDLMQLAKGKYLASCESDDYWTSNDKLQKQVDFLEKHKEYIGCTHPVICIDKKGDKLKRQSIKWISNKKVYSLKDFRGIVLPGHSCSVVRRNIFLNPQYDYSIMWKASKYIGDRTSTLLFAAQGDFFRFDEPMACYRIEMAKNSENLTWKLYQNHEGRGWIGKELDFTLRLEEYSKQVLHVDAGFEYYKRELLASAILEVFKRKPKIDKKIVKEVYSSLDNSFMALLLLPVIIIRKAFKKAFN